MEYVAQIITFLIAVAGVTGETWSKDKEGIFKFKPLGWFLFTLASIFLVISIFTTFNNNENKRLLAKQKAQIRYNLNAQLCFASERVIDTLRHENLLFMQIGTTNTEGMPSYYLGLRFEFERNEDEESLPLTEKMNNELRGFMALWNAVLNGYQDYLDFEFHFIASQIRMFELSLNDRDLHSNFFSKLDSVLSSQDIEPFLEPLKLEVTEMKGGTVPKGAMEAAVNKINGSEYDDHFQEVRSEVGKLLKLNSLIKQVNKTAHANLKASASSVLQLSLLEQLQSALASQSKESKRCKVYTRGLQDYY